MASFTRMTRRRYARWPGAMEQARRRFVIRAGRKQERRLLMKRLTITASTIALLAGAAAAQGVGDWTQEQMYSGDYASGWELLDADVYDRTGEDLGEVESIFIRDDKIIAITAEVGGFLDIGDSHVVIPFEEVEWTAEGMTVPINEDNVEEYDAWAEDSMVTKALSSIKIADDGDVMAGDRTYRLYELIADYAVTSDGENVGYVRDVLFNQNGEIEGLIYSSRYGMRATPFMGYRPGSGIYNLPYTVEDVENVQPMDMNRVEDRSWF
jgi:sporulation protein YlmC with PRC-barrel domain